MTLLPRPEGEIRPEPPAASLLTVARTVPFGFDEWRSGIAWYPNGCTPAAGWSDCDDPTRPPEKCDPRPQGSVIARPWTMYLPEGGCDDPSPGIDWNDRARVALDAYRAGQVSRELATGEHTPGVPSLEGVASSLVTPGAVSVTEALSLLLQARINAGFAGMHMAHVPLWLIPSAEAQSLLTGSTTTMGNVRVSPGPGYPGRNPVDVGVPVDPATGQGWVFMSSPVEYGLGPVTTPMEREDQKHRTNRSFWIAEQMAIVRFDPCGVFAVLARIGE